MPRAKGQTKQALKNKKIGLGVSKMSPEKIKKLEEAFSLDCSIPEACFLADIAIQTYYNWINKNPELLERFNRVREKPVYLARKSVIEGFQNDPNLALKYLERKKKKEFSTLQIESGEQPNITINLT